MVPKLTPKTKNPTWSILLCHQMSTSIDPRKKKNLDSDLLAIQMLISKYFAICYYYYYFLNQNKNYTQLDLQEQEKAA